MKNKIIHCLAWCTNCKWEESNYKTARRKAREHAKKTGHTVTGEVGYSFSYNAH